MHATKTQQKARKTSTGPVFGVALTWAAAKWLAIKAKGSTSDLEGWAFAFHHECMQCPRGVRSRIKAHTGKHLVFSSSLPRQYPALARRNDLLSNRRHYFYTVPRRSFLRFVPFND